MNSSHRAGAMEKLKRVPSGKGVQYYSKRYMARHNTSYVLASV